MPTPQETQMARAAWLRNAMPVGDNSVLGSEHRGAAFIVLGALAILIIVHRKV